MPSPRAPRASTSRCVHQRMVLPCDVRPSFLQTLALYVPTLTSSSRTPPRRRCTSPARWARRCPWRWPQSTRAPRASCSPIKRRRRRSRNVENGKRSGARKGTKQQRTRFAPKMYFVSLLQLEKAWLEIRRKKRHPMARLLSSRNFNIAFCLMYPNAPVGRCTNVAAVLFFPAFISGLSRSSMLHMHTQ